MKLGLLTAALPGMTLPEVAQWAADSGYQMLEIACWPKGKSERRYGGVTHIDVDTLDAAKAREIRLGEAILESAKTRSWVTVP